MRMRQRTEVHVSLGNALMDQGDAGGAVAVFRQALELKPDDPVAHINLGNALRRQGRLQDALSELERGHELGSKTRGWSYPSAEWVRSCRQAIELDARLP